MTHISEQADNHKAENLIPSNQWGSIVATDTKMIEKNLHDIKHSIAPYNVKIVAVTKYFGLDGIKRGYEVGLRDFGESRALDAIMKIDALEEEIRLNSTFHFIGHLQSNKAEKVVKYFDYIHSVDSLKLASIISDIACGLNKREKVLLQVNNAEEEQKFGYSKTQLVEDMPEILKLKGIEIVGLMNMAQFGVSEDVLKDTFRGLREFRDELQNKFSIELPELSMGMSNDYQIAIQEGATIIRLGRKLFS
jgi:pyridoxal phosphate enzyme (YggS family)